MCIVAMEGVKSAEGACIIRVRVSMFESLTVCEFLCKCEFGCEM